MVYYNNLAADSVTKMEAILVEGRMHDLFFIAAPAAPAAPLLHQRNKLEREKVYLFHSNLLSIIKMCNKIHIIYVYTYI